MWKMFDLKDKNTSFSHRHRLNCGGKILDLESPKVMGVLNVTPDSFYDGGRFREGKVILDGVARMLEEGASIIDIGAVSTKPHAVDVRENLEKARLLPVLKMVRKQFPEVILSIYTFRANIARICVDEGAGMINDISGGVFDPAMLDMVAKLNVPFVIMHIQGTPKNMQDNPHYDDVVKEVKDFLFGQAVKLKSLGKGDIIIDPGFGFGKTVEHNFELLNRLDQFIHKDYPLMAGLSRKSMINRVLHTKPSEALNGTTVLNTIALLKGVNILRVHDVKEAIEAIKLISYLGK